MPSSRRHSRTYFLDSAIQSNIRQSKEEQFQEGFLRELFVKVLGYTLNPTPDYNLITEQKNETYSDLNGNLVGVDGQSTTGRAIRGLRFVQSKQVGR